MEAALRDYSNSFNSLQSVNQVWHPIILLRLPCLGRREGGEERSGALCSWQLLHLTLSHMSSVGLLQLSGYLPGPTALQKLWLGEVLWMQEGGHSSVGTRLSHPSRWPCWLHGGIYTLQLGASSDNASIAGVFVSGHMSFQGELSANRERVRQDLIRFCLRADRLLHTC